MVKITLHIIAGLLLLACTQSTFFKTMFLIARVSPYEQPGAGNVSLLVLGDSTGYGTGASDSRYSVAGLIGTAYPDLSIKNNSVNGRTIGGLRRDIETLEGEYDVVLLQIGANDILQKRPLQEVRQDLEVVWRTLSPKTKHIVMISSGNVGGAVRFKGTKEEAYFQTKTIEFVAMVQELQIAWPKVTYVDLFEAPEADPFVQDPKHYTAFDGLHPSDAGYARWYVKLQPALEQVIKI